MRILHADWIYVVPDFAAFLDADEPYFNMANAHHGIKNCRVSNLRVFLGFRPPITHGSIIAALQASSSTPALKGTSSHAADRVSQRSGCLGNCMMAEASPVKLLCKRGFGIVRLPRQPHHRPPPLALNFWHLEDYLQFCD